MTDRTFFLTRGELYNFLGSDVMVRKFETLQENVAVTTEASTAAVADTEALKDATFVTLSANAELPNERVLAVGPGMQIDATQAGRAIIRSNVYSDNGWEVQLVASGATSLVLPIAGILATRAGEETLSNKTLAAPKVTGLVNAANDAAAATAGVPVNGLYLNGSVLQVRVA